VALSYVGSNKCKVSPSSLLFAEAEIFVSGARHTTHKALRFDHLNNTSVCGKKMRVKREVTTNKMETCIFEAIPLFALLPLHESR
jgi:hypothetical protein